MKLIDKVKKFEMIYFIAILHLIKITKFENNASGLIHTHTLDTNLIFSEQKRKFYLKQCKERVIYTR